MKFLPVFDVRVTHSYYADGRCPDFLVEPTSRTQKLLRDHRCVAKTRPDGIGVLAAVDAKGKLFIPIPRDATFAFHLRLQNADFPLFTDLAGVNHQPAPLYTNATMDPSDGTALALESRTAYFSETLAVVAPAPEERYTLSGRPAEGLDTGDLLVESSGRINRIDAYDPRDRVIAVDSRSAAPGDTFTITYPVTPRLGSGVFADVEILANDTLSQVERPSADPRIFRVVFDARWARWVYYCVTDLSGPIAEFRVVDGSPSDSAPRLVFGNENRTELNEDLDPSDAVATDLAERYPGLRRFRFVSDELVPCRDAARKHLELHADGNRLSGPLPNPPFRNHSTLHAKVGETLQQQDAFFQVVKYLSHSFPKTRV